MRKIGVTAVSFVKSPELMERLQQANLGELKINSSGKVLTAAESAEFLADCDAALVGGDPVNDTVLSAATRLQVVSKYGVGLDNIDFDACRRHNVQVLFRPGVNREAVAEQALAFAIILLRNIHIISGRLKEGQWDKRGGCSLSEMQVGILGAGFVGSELMRLLQPFGCRILFCDILKKPELTTMYDAEQVPLERLLQESDLLSLHLPLDSSTRKIINAGTIAQMKRGSFIINTCRGGVVDEAALADALRSGQIAGVASDVFEQEPNPNPDLVTLENFIGTPHTCGNSRKAVRLMGSAAVELLEEYFQGK